jgi:hypothetical protein
MRARHGRKSDVVYFREPRLATECGGLLPKDREALPAAFPAALHAGGGGSVSYGSYRLRSGALLLLPRRRGPRSSSLALYNPFSALGRVRKALIQTGVWRGSAVRLAADALEDLMEQIGTALHRECTQCAFYIGTPGLHAKCTVLALDSRGTVLAYGKLGSAAAVLREWKTLERLRPISEIAGRVPEPLAFLQWRGQPLLLISAGPTGNAPRHFGAAHAHFLDALYRATGHDQPLVETAMWREMNWLFAKWRHALPDHWLRRYELALALLIDRVGTQRLPTSMAHRDFAPWNTREAHSGELFVFDWESGGDGYPRGFDLLHFHVVSAVAGARPLSTRTLTKAAAEASAFDADALVLAYLTDVSLLYHHSALARNKSAEGRLLRLSGALLDEVMYS